MINFDLYIFTKYLLNRTYYLLNSNEYIKVVLFDIRHIKKKNQQQKF